MKPPLRIAILECDTPLDGTRTKYGGYGGVFKALLEAGAQAVREADPSIATTKSQEEELLKLNYWDVVNKKDYPALDEIDAVLLTGSREFYTYIHKLSKLLSYRTFVHIGGRQDISGLMSMSNKLD